MHATYFSVQDQKHLQKDQLKQLYQQHQQQTKQELKEQKIFSFTLNLLVKFAEEFYDKEFLNKNKNQNVHS